MLSITIDVIQVLNFNSLFIEYFITSIYMGPYKYFIRAVSTLCVLFIPFKSGIQIFTTQSQRNAMRSLCYTSESAAHDFQKKIPQQRSRLFLFPQENFLSTCQNYWREGNIEVLRRHLRNNSTKTFRLYRLLYLSKKATIYINAMRN